jgi:small conductance mechanosensitive channel
MLIHFDQTWSLLVGKLSGWLRETILLLPNLLLAVLVMVLFWLAARVTRDLMLRLVRRISHNPQINELLAQTFYVAVVSAGLFSSLGILGLDRAVTSLLAGAGIVGLALSLAFQGIAANFISGIYLSVERPFQTGNLIETNGVLGTVEHVSLLWTEIRSPQGQVVLLPNKKVFEDVITNFTTSGKRRVDLKLKIAYEVDLAKAREMASVALADAPFRTGDVEVFYQEPGDSAIDLVVGFWIDATGLADYQAARGAAIERLKIAFDQEGMPLPNAKPVPPPAPNPTPAATPLAESVAAAQPT